MPPDQPTRNRPLTVAAGLVVTVLAGGAFVLTYDLLRDFAVAGRASDRWAPAYPVMADALTVITVLALIVARNASWWSRWLRGTLLLALAAGTAAIAVQHALWGFADLPAGPTRAGVAVAPHVMLITAVWLWLRMIRHLRPGRTAPIKPIKPTEPEPEPEPAPPPLPTEAEAAGAPDAGPPPLPFGKRPQPATDEEEEEDGDTSEDLPIWDWNPPSGSFRSSPTPPVE